ncbi:hypothetical protein Sps_02762 [Shewanella psychrophila]|uniref:EamA domain-containing protein n=1 Tax=Shewanella psychrophila TaxID=225848 RepID=A0A1S6HQZ8_9GAMM|nr:DMT family transporter [Shewanella psychrophila]AQS37914.1 hypothetical protein Sps_02762 [Shewanella psychrophila]
MPVETWQERSLWSILYLGVFGSQIGFISYFYILQNLKASTVALVTLITPVFAMMLGAQLNDETITDSLVIGAMFVISGLGLYQFGETTIDSIRRKQLKKKSSELK